MEEQAHPFDFKAHGDAAVSEYLRVYGFYRDLADSIRRIVEEGLRRRDIRVHSVQARAKDPNSFGKKAARPSESDPTKPKYPNPLSDITDLGAVRVIAFFPGTVAAIEQIVAMEFNVVERSDKGQLLLEEERFGYQSIHFLVRLNENRATLPEYDRFKNVVTEIQVRTILQHAWAEIEHDIQYKAASVIPAEIRRRFMALAGMLEIVDREFQAIQDVDAAKSAEARVKVREGQLDEVEVTPDAVKNYLDRKLGSDGRISEWTYNLTARLLRRLGFQTLREVDNAIEPFNDDRLSYLASGARQGQTSRFEYMLLAALGEEFIKRHPRANEPWLGSYYRHALAKFSEAGIDVGTFLAKIGQAPNTTLQPPTPTG